MKITYVEGDLFTAIEDIEGMVVIPHVCNNIGAFGAGFVVPLGRHFPAAREVYLKQWRGFELGDVQFVEVAKNRLICNMFGQEGLIGMSDKPPIRYNAIEACLDKVYLICSKLENTQIHAPMFGAGLAGGDWNLIELMIQHLWVDRKIPTTIYYLPGTLPKNWKLPKGE